MKIRTCIEASNIISSLGQSTSEAMEEVLSGRGGIQSCKDPGLSDLPFPASRIAWENIEKEFKELASPSGFTRFEQIAILSMHDALSSSRVSAGGRRTGLILSTTKGNVELLSGERGFSRDRLSLWKSAKIMADFFGMSTRPLVVSNACISGVASILLARRLIRSGRFDHVVVVGADVLSRFIVSGFQSFLSLSREACRPFDADRDGLTLGEAAATVVVSREYGDIEVLGGAISNDANHISGPSRTGEGLYLAIMDTLAGDFHPDMVSAHGTATLYNDEMESLALSRSELGKVPVNSLKGYFGHTLGAAGVLESIINIQAMKRGVLLPTLGFVRTGVSGEINVQDAPENRDIQRVLKIASGFGGCNAAILFRKMG